MVLFREFHIFGPNLDIEFRITFVLDERKRSSIT